MPHVRPSQIVAVYISIDIITAKEITKNLMRYIWLTRKVKQMERIPSTGQIRA